MAVVRGGSGRHSDMVQPVAQRDQCHRRHAGPARHAGIGRPDGMANRAAASRSPLRGGQATCNSLSVCFRTGPLPESVGKTDKRSGPHHIAGMMRDLLRPGNEMLRSNPYNERGEDHGIRPALVGEPDGDASAIGHCDGLSWRLATETAASGIAGRGRAGSSCRLCGG